MDIILSDFWKGVKLVLFYKWVSDLTPVQAKEVLGAYLCLMKEGSAGTSSCKYSSLYLHSWETEVQRELLPKDAEGIAAYRCRSAEGIAA